MALSPTERAKVWNSLDPNLREKVKNGELTIEEAGSFVVPIGDLEMQRMAAAGPGPLTAKAGGLDAEAPAEEYDSGTALETGLLRGGQAIDTLQMGAGLEAAAANQRAAEIAAGTRGAQGGFNLTQAIEANRGKPFGEAAFNIASEAITQPITNAAEAIGAAVMGEGALRDRATAAGEFSNEQVTELTRTRDALAKLPVNQVSTDFISAFDAGNYTEAAKLLPAAAYYTTLEQAPTLGVQATATGLTAAITRNPVATAAVARSAGALGGLSEIGSDYESLLAEMPEEDRNNPQKMLEAFRLAAKASGVRAAVEAIAPGTGLGKSLTSKVATLTAAQMASEAGGEYLAAQTMGQERSAGELALEALASGPLSAIAESGGVLRADRLAREAAVDRGTGEAEQFLTLQQEADRRVGEFIKGNEAQAAIDIEAEAQKAIEALKMQSPTQTELPFGSELTADPTATDRLPTIKDMFSGQETAAPTLADEQARVPVDQMPEETDEAFEIRKQRETDARNQIDARKQTDFETKKQKQEVRKRQLAEDETTLKQERQLLSNAGIKQEAERRLAIELEGVRNLPINKPASKQAALPKILKAYERKRKPELLEEVREQQTQKVTSARERIANQKALEDIEVENELGRRQDAKRKAEAKPSPEPATDLFGDQPATELFEQPTQPSKPRFTGTLTEKQAQRELAAGQLERQKQTEKLAPAEKAKQAAALEAEIPTVSKAIAGQLQKKASLTAKTYAASEKKALDAIVEDELTKNPKRPQEETVKAVASRMAAWRKSNPRPETVPAPVNDPVLQKANEVAKNAETAQKTKQSRNLTEQLKKEIKKGATPQQAAETVRAREAERANATNRQLTPEEDANLRSELGGNPTVRPAIVEDTFDVNGRKYRKRESTDVREALDEITSDDRRNPPNQLGKLLQAVAKSNDSTPGEKWLAARLAPLADSLGITVTQIAPPGVRATWLGAFTPTNNSIWINAADAETVLHESLHAVTNNILDSSLRRNNPRVKAAYTMLSDAMEEARVYFALNPDSVEDRISFQRLANANGGALSNLTEFVSYGLTDPGIKSWLHSIKVPGKPFTVWQKFKEAIKGLFGARTETQRTVLDDIMEATEELIRIQEESPAINAWVTAAARQRAGLGFTKVASAPIQAPDTPQFNAWFGDSKVVDADGNPMVVYHGTDKTFKEFSTRTVGRKGVLNPGFFFANSPGVAASFATWDWDVKTRTPRSFLARMGITEVAPRTLPVYLSIQNPLTLDQNDDIPSRADVAELKKQGYDGLRITSTRSSSRGDVWVAFDPNQIKSATGNTGNFDPRKADIAASQEFDEEENTDFTDPTTKRSLLQLGNGKVSAKFKPEWLSSPVGTLMDALTAGGGRESATTEVFERAQSSTAALILRAEQLFRNIDYNLEKQAVKAKTDMQAYRDGFTAGITNFENAEGLDKKQQAKKLHDKYGQAARSYFLMRRTMDNLSRDILRQRLEDPRPFTKAEAKIYRSIKENIGTYYTRVYAANTKGLGEERARKLWKEYTKRAKGDLNPEFKDGYDIVRNAAVFVRNNLLTIPERDELESMPLVKLQKLADAWGVAPQQAADLDNPLVADSRRELIIDALEKFADATPQTKDKRAISLVEDVLFSRENATLTNYFRGAKQDRTIVTERESVPEPIRKLMGEYEDLPLRAMITITRQAEFRARNKAFNELRAQEEGTRIMTDEQFTEEGLSAQDWTKLNGVGYGTLDGMWVRNDLAKKIEDSAEVQRTFDQVLAMADSRPLEPLMFWARKGIESWSKLAGFVKSIQLVWNLGNAVFNFMGGPLIQLSNGNMNPKYTKRAFDTALALIEGAGGKGGQLTQDMEKVVRAGITDSAFMGEIRAVELEKLRQLTLEALRSPGEKSISKGIQQFKAGTRRWRETYAMADVVWKIANFYTEEAKLEAFYKAEGIKKAPEAIEREAARKTNVSNFSYKRVPNLFKIGEKAGLTYIMPYIYETFRAPVGSFLIGVSDMKRAAEATTPKGKQIMYVSGAKRLIGSTLALGVMQQLIFELAKQVAGVTDEEEEMVEDFKALLPEYKRDADFLYMGKTEDGKPVLFEFSRLDPMGPSTEFYRLAQRGAEPEEFLDAAKRLVIANPSGNSLLKAVLGTGSTSTRMESFDPRAYELATDVVGERGAKAIDALLPSQLVRPLDPRNEGPKDDELAEALTWMGIQLHQVDPARATQFAANQFDMGKREIKTDMYNFLKNQHNLTDEQVLREFNDLREREDENFEGLERVYNGLTKVGYTPAQAVALLKSMPQPPSDSDLTTVYTGGYRPESSNLVSMQGIERSWEAAVKNRNMDDKVKEQYRNNLVRVLRLAGEGKVPVSEE